MSNLEPLPNALVEPAVRRALEEDLGRAGDITTDAVVPRPATATAVIAARQRGRIAGLDAAMAAFRLIDPNLAVEPLRADGALVAPGDALVRIDGRARGILTAERVALNFLGHLSGVASATHALVEAVAGTNVRICCTRKTTPGLRAFEKYAVRAGGGVNHRFGLDDAILIKDNHIVAAGGITPALKRAQARAGHLVGIEIEVDTIDQLEEALAAGARLILLDNMPPEMLRQAVAINAGVAVLEASGGVTLETAPAIAATGVDFISVGWITHSAPCLDIGLDFEGLTAG